MWTTVHHSRHARIKYTDYRTARGSNSAYRSAMAGRDPDMNMGRPTVEAAPPIRTVIIIIM